MIAISLLNFFTEFLIEFYPCITFVIWFSYLFSYSYLTYSSLDFLKRIILNSLTVHKSPFLYFEALLVSFGGIKFT